MKSTTQRPVWRVKQPKSSPSLDVPDSWQLPWARLPEPLPSQVEPHLKNYSVDTIFRQRRFMKVEQIYCCSKRVRTHETSRQEFWELISSAGRSTNGYPSWFPEPLSPWE